MMEAVRTSETSVDNYFTRQYIPEDNSELNYKCLKSKISGLGRILCNKENHHLYKQYSIVRTLKLSTLIWV
jgi:hypothetical protein